jgi:hypothetical protein
VSKTFYTERDIEDLARQGVHSLTVNDEVVLTELAVERAERLGIALVSEHAAPPSAPMRPYIAEWARPAGAAKRGSPPGSEDLHQRVYAAVVQRLGGEVDPALLNTIIRRVLDNIGS